MALFLAMLQQPSSPGDEAIKQAVARGLADSGPFRVFGWPGALIPIMSTLSFFSVVALIGWLLYRRSQARLEARTNLHRQLLDKFTSGAEFAAFLNSSGGQRLLEDLWSQRTNAKDRIIRSLQGGVVLTVLGFVVLAVSLRNHGVALPGALVFALGAGLLMSTAVSYKVSKKLGLLQEPTSRHDEGSRP